MPNLTHARRDRLPSKRAALALGGVIATIVGVSATTDTMAASTDSSTATASQIATQNFFPTPLAASLTCSTTPHGAFEITKRRVTYSWPAIAGVTGYRLEIINRSDGASVLQTYDYNQSTTTSGEVSDSSRKGIYARLRTLNNGAVSSGYTVSNSGASFKDYVSGRTECEGTTGTNLANQTWENQAGWTPSSPAVNGRASRVLSPRGDSEGETTTSTEPSATPSKTPSTSDATSTPSTSSAPSSTASTSTAPSSAPPKSSIPEEPVLAGVTVDGAKRTLVLTRGDRKLCTIDLAEGDSYSFNGNNLSITNGDAVKRIDPATCTVI